MKIKANEANRIYSMYNEEVQTVMKHIHSYLIKKYKRIQNEWLAPLSMLADNYNIFFQCRDAIKLDGLMVVDRFGALVKHPLLKTQTDAQIQIVKLLAEFGLSPKSAAKLNDDTDEEDDNSPLSLFLNNDVEKR
ncbi:P27 family phage terminase small subunit [Bacteroides thetaiotaomicron]|uniref:P27 family phage terminase small subunit n=1 Tax=Bacteroides thetaiotaomicron TaxID=818 RepID=UPI0039C49087